MQMFKNRHLNKNYENGEKNPPTTILRAKNPSQFHYAAF